MEAAKLQSIPKHSGAEAATREEPSSSDIVERKVDAIWQRLQNFEPVVQQLLRLLDDRLT